MGCKLACRWIGEERTMLEVKELNIAFHDRGKEEHVVKGISMNIAQGECVGIVGESGSGKTMTAWCIAGLSKRKEMKKTGVILFEGLDLLSCSRKELRQVQGKEVGIIFQEPMTSLNPVKKIGWQLEESLRIHTKLQKKDRYIRAINALKDVELSNVEDVYQSYPHELSGGMRQRVMIAIAMICEPKLLIADEPTTALDVTIQMQIIKLLQKLSRTKHISILFISHDLSLVRQLCNRVIVMKDGRIIEQGDTEAVFKNPKQRYTKQLIEAIPKCKKLED